MKSKLVYKQCKISDIQSNVSHATAMGPFGSNIKTDNYVSSGIPVIRGKNILNGFLDERDFVYLTEKKADELLGSNTYPEDVLLVAQGNVGHVGYIPKEVLHRRFVLSQNLMKLTVDSKKADPLFVFYYLRSPDGQQMISQYKNPTGVPCLSQPLTSFRNMMISLPELKIQKKISKIISSLDSQIKNIQNQNKILEQTAQAIFKSWFVDFDGVKEWDDSELGKIPKNWKIAKLGEHTIIKGRIGWKGLTQSEYAVIGYHLVTGRQIVNEIVDWDSCPRVSEERYFESPDIMLRKEDILMSKDGTIGRLSFIDELLFQASVGTGIFVIRSNSDYIDQYFLLAFFKSNIFKDIVKSRTEGSVIPHLYQRDIQDFNIALPMSPIIKKFSKIYKDLLYFQHSNKSQISKLTKIRDVLLPKLMSGEIRV